jgi:hypothetical protein
VKLSDEIPSDIDGGNRFAAAKDYRRALDAIATTNPATVALACGHGDAFRAEIMT